MPAPVASRRFEGGPPGFIAPDAMYVPGTPQRYAIIALGLVVAVTTLPLGVLPTLLPGQTAILSTTLQVGDRV